MKAETIKHEKLDIGLSTSALEETGNDRFIHNNGRIAIMDFSGHSKEHAKPTELVAGIIKSALLRNEPLHEALNHANNEIFNKLYDTDENNDKYASVLAFEKNDKGLIAISGGHPEPLFIYRDLDGKLSYKYATEKEKGFYGGGLVNSISPVTHEKPEGTLSENGIWIAYTDGMLENLRGNGKESRKVFAETIIQVLKEHFEAHENMELLVRLAHARIKALRKKQVDDEMIVAIKTKGFNLMRKLRS